MENMNPKYIEEDFVACQFYVGNPPNVTRDIGVGSNHKYYSKRLYWIDQITDYCRLRFPFDNPLDFREQYVQWLSKERDHAHNHD